VQRIALQEYRSVDIELSADAARLLAGVAGPRLSVALGPEPGKWTVTATSHVGTITVPDLQLLIRPKASLHNVFQMLDVAPESFARDPFGFEADRSLLAVMAHLLARATERAIGAGLLRAYRVEEDRLLALRGRIDVGALIRRPALTIPVPCRFDEYTADIPENRALKAALRRLLRVPGVPPAVRRTMSLAVARFEAVQDANVDPQLLDRVVYTRLNRHYRPALELAALILRNLTLIDRIGSDDASAFLVDMNDLFQRWVLDRLRKHLRGRLAVAGEPTVHLGTKRQVPMAPDLVFYEKDELAYVADTKYKLTSTGVGRSSDYYQLLAYTTAMDLDEGLLIYCQADGQAPDREVVARHSGKRLRTHAIDLAGTPDEAEAAVAALADLIWTRARMGSAVV
jgi:5-methylcytosine-specific restriction enzyme subunit McrC